MNKGNKIDQIVMVLCTNTLDQPDAYVAVTSVNDHDYHLGMHFDLAIAYAQKSGFKGPFSCYDQTEMSNLIKAVKLYQELVSKENYAILLEFNYGWDFINSEDIELMTQHEALVEVHDLCRDRVDWVGYDVDELKVVRIDHSEYLDEVDSYTEYLRKTESVNNNADNNTLGQCIIPSFIKMARNLLSINKLTN